MSHLSLSRKPTGGQIVAFVLLTVLLLAVAVAAETAVVYVIATWIAGWNIELREAFAVALYSTLVSSGIQASVKR